MEGVLLLARWPIRVKLLGALVILTAIMGTLAFSGFWGLYGYRHLATTVSERAAELPLSNQLTRSASEMSDACHRVQSGLVAAYSIDAKLHAITFRAENDRFHDALHVYQDTLQRYQDLYQVVHGSEHFLTEYAEQATILESLQKQLNAIETTDHAELWTLTTQQLDSLQVQLYELVEETEQLPKLLHARMAGFRNDVRGQYRTMITLAWSSLIAAVLMVGVLLWYFRSLVVRPFRMLLQGSRLVARGDLDHRIDLGTGDEFSELADAMNNMTDRFQRTYDELEAVCRDLDNQVRDRTREVVQSEQLASVGFLAAGVAHEINNPLASIAWSAEALESRLHDLLHCSAAPTLTSDQIESLKANLRRIQEEAFRCKGITERLLDFSRMEEVRLSATDLSELVADVVAMVRTLGQYRCKTINLHTPGAVIADINGQQIKQVVLNLLTNALESVDKEGAVEITVSNLGNVAKISVEDNGCGMTDEVLEHLFEPFFTRRRDGRGTGLGLSITYRIVNQHGGQLTASSEGPGRGARLEVTLPVKASSNVTQERSYAA